MPPLLLVAAAALLDSQNRVLLAQRPRGKSMAGLWEFPGGKLHENETPEHALSRELHEELGLIINPQNFTPLTFTSHAYPDFHLLMPLFACRTWQGTPEPRENQRLLWATKDDLTTLPMPPADIPLIPAVRNLL